MKTSKVRKLLIAKSILLQEYPNRATLNGINHILSAYLTRAGKATYLSEMLGPLATEKASEAHFYTELGYEVSYQLDEGETIAELLRHIDNWPFRIEWQGGIRYV